MKYINSNKLEKLDINKDNTYMILDFDRTITSSKSCDSWDAIAKEGIVSKDIKNEMNVLYEKYRPIELDYNISKEDKEKAMYIWYVECMNLYYKYNLSREDMIKSIRNSNLIFRDGAREFLKKINTYNIPIIILSAGIGNAIEGFLKDNGIYSENLSIISNFITFNKKGEIEKIEDEKIINSSNKILEKHLNNHILEKIKGRDNKILVGDLIEDANMIKKSEFDKTIRIAFLDVEVEKNLNEYNKNFDIVLTNEDANFGDVEDILF